MLTAEHINSINLIIAENAVMLKNKEIADFTIQITANTYSDGVKIKIRNVVLPIAEKYYRKKESPTSTVPTHEPVKAV